MCIRDRDRYSAEVYNLETIAALAFRVESFGAAKVRKALLDRIMHGRKENNMVFLSLNVGSQAVVSYCRIGIIESVSQSVH